VGCCYFLKSQSLHQTTTFNHNSINEFSNRILTEPLFKCNILGFYTLHILSTTKPRPNKTRKKAAHHIRSKNFCSPNILMVCSAFLFSKFIPIRAIKHGVEHHWLHNCMSVSSHRSPLLQFSIFGPALLVPVSAVIFVSGKWLHSWPRHSSVEGWC
jgi:hypothetical protein